MARYATVYRLPENLHSEDAPVIVEAGAVLEDTQKGKKLVQLKMKNISMASIQKVVVRILTINAEGNIIGQPVMADYVEVNAVPNTSFGQQRPIYLAEEGVRSIEIQVTDVFMSDGTVWSAKTNNGWKKIDDALYRQLQQTAQERQEQAKKLSNEKQLNAGIGEGKKTAIISGIMAIVAIILTVWGLYLFYVDAPYSTYFINSLSNNLMRYLLALVLPGITLVLTILKKGKYAKILFYVSAGMTAIQVIAAIIIFIMNRTLVPPTSFAYSLLIKINGSSLINRVFSIARGGRSYIILAIGDLLYIVKNGLCAVVFWKAAKE